jgi:hypothetical protein
VRRTGFKNLIICWPIQSRPSTRQEELEDAAVLATKPNHVASLDGRLSAHNSDKDQKPNGQSDLMASQPAEVVGGPDKTGSNGLDHVEEEETVSCSDPRMRSAEIHGSKLKEKKRQKQQQQQQRWSFTDNPSNGSTSSSSGQINPQSKMAARASADIRMPASAGAVQPQLV